MSGEWFIKKRHLKDSKDWNTRLRYVKVNEEERTEIPVICNKIVCHGYVKGNNWRVINLLNNRCIAEGESRDNDEAKRHLKKSLVSFGAYFVDEVRATKANPIRMITDKLIAKLTEGNDNEKNS